VDAKNKRVRPDGSLEPEQKLDPEAVKGFLDTLNGIEEKMNSHVANASTIRVLDEANGDVVREIKGADPDSRQTQADLEANQAAIVAKVAAFLDPKLRGPIFTAVVRNKFFIGKFPVQQEMVDVKAVVGYRPGTIPTVAESYMSIVGELKKCIYGWLPEKAPEVQIVRAHVNDPSKWPKLNDEDWLETRDPFVAESEVYPLWDKYMEWRAQVQPTREEIDFYYSLMR